jgi:hypothetical protein
LFEELFLGDDLASVRGRHHALVSDLLCECAVAFVTDPDDDWCLGVEDHATERGFVEHAECHISPTASCEHHRACTGTGYSSVTRLVDASIVEVTRYEQRAATPSPFVYLLSHSCM